MQGEHTIETNAEPLYGLIKRHPFSLEKGLKTKAVGLLEEFCVPFFFLCNVTVTIIGTLRLLSRVDLFTQNITASVCQLVFV